MCVSLQHHLNVVTWLESTRTRPPQRSAGLWLPPIPTSLPSLTLPLCSSLYSHPRAITPAILSAQRHPYFHSLHPEVSADQVTFHQYHSTPARHTPFYPSLLWFPPEHIPLSDILSNLYFIYCLPLPLEYRVSAPGSQL